MSAAGPSRGANYTPLGQHSGESRKRGDHKSAFRFAVAVTALLCCHALHAQDYPTRPVRVIVPFSPGGAVDGPMRVIAQDLSKRLGQQVFVENKPGAGAMIGSEIVAKAAPDGYTLLLASQTNAISASLYRTLSFDPIDDFAPIALVGREPGVLVVHPSLPVHTLAEFIGYVKERPGKVDYASSGNGSGQHLFMALLASTTGMQLNHVPYRGSGQATTDLLAGVVPVSIPGTAGMVGHIKAGKLRPLACQAIRRTSGWGSSHRKERRRRSSIDCSERWRRRSPATRCGVTWKPWASRLWDRRRPNSARFSMRRRSVGRK